MKVEMAVESLEGALIANKMGFDSIEVNSALALGGLSPGIGLLRAIIERVDLDIICMLRNRPAGFLYTDREYKEMLFVLDCFLEENIKGIAFGFLTKDYKLDEVRTKTFVDRIHRKGRIAVFHRAIDNTIDYEGEIKRLIELGVDRVLTSGQAESAIDGSDKIFKIQEKYGEKIEILAGAGLNSQNVIDFINRTGVKYIHSSCKTYREDVTSKLNVSYSVYPDKPFSYLVNSEDEAKKFLENSRRASER